MTDAALALLAPDLAAAAGTGGDPLPGGGLLQGGLSVYEIYRCADDCLVAVAGLEPPCRAELARVVGRVPGTRAQMAALLGTRRRDAWAEALSDGCVTPVLSPLEALEAPVFHERGRSVGVGAARRSVPPYWGDHTFVQAPAPAPGAYGAEVLRGAGAPEALIAEVCG